MRNLSRFVLTSVLAVICHVSSTTVSAAPGGLDPTFSGDGKLLDFLSRGDDSARGIAIQVDGKIVVAGASWTGRDSDFAVARYNSDGSLDTTFGVGGKVITDINSGYDQANAIALQLDGKIVAAGTDGSDFTLVRYNSDGTLDTSFGAGGKTITHISSGWNSVFSVATQVDGKIVAVGGNAVVRYNADGSLDTTFDSDGKASAVFPSYGFSLYSVAIQSDGKVVAAGQGFRQVTQSNDFALVRFSVDGSPDTSFGNGGLVTTQIGIGGSAATSLAIQPDGKIVAAGFANAFGLVRYSSNGSPENIITITLASPSYYDYARSVAIQPDGKIVVSGGSIDRFAVVRLNANFSMDTTFGSNGRVTTPTGSYAGAEGIAVQTDGKIVITGSGSGDGSSDDFTVVRYSANGSLDTSFDGDGKATTDFGFFYGNALYDTAIQADGKIVAVGGVRSDFAILRYNSDGSPDTTFGSGTGKVRTAMGYGGWAAAVAIQADGRIVVAGSTSDGDGNGCCIALARYNVDGSLDTSFGTNGKVITFSPGYYSGADDVAIQPDGKIVVVGGAVDATHPNGGFAVYRYDPDGSPDTSFDGDGLVITPIGSYARASAVIIQPDGKLVATGNTGSYSDNEGTFAAVRYNANGSLDPTFDGDGVVTTHTSERDVAYSSVLQTDGKIIVAGSGYDTGNDYYPTEFTVIRYNGNGSLDTTFGSGGLVTIQTGAYSEAHAVALQADGKIVAAAHSVALKSDFALVRIDPNGSLDRSFGDNGIATADFDQSYDYAYGLALDNVGNAVVVGGSDGRFALARFGLVSPQVSVSGRVTDPNGKGLRNAAVSVTDQFGARRTTITGSFGFYSFDNISSGGTYTISVASRRYKFTPRTVTPNQNLTDVDLVGTD